LILREPASAAWILLLPRQAARRLRPSRREETTMRGRGMVLGLIAIMAGLAGCSTAGVAPSASPPSSTVTSEQLACERTGGWWRPQLNYCEYESPSIPPR
jgi:hypothetical protein